MWRETRTINEAARDLFFQQKQHFTIFLSLQLVITLKKKTLFILYHGSLRLCQLRMYLQLVALQLPAPLSSPPAQSKQLN